MRHRLIPFKRWDLLRGCVSVLLVMGLLAASGVAYAQLGNTPWPKFGQNLQNTGQSPFGGAGASWQNDFGTAQTGPSIASDGTIYIAGPGVEGDDALYAIDPATGIPDWDFTLSDFSARSVQPVIGGDGTIYIGGNNSDQIGELYAFEPDGNLKSTFFFSASDPIQTAPVIASDGTIYVMTTASEGSQVYGIDPATGDTSSVVDIGRSTASPTIASDGTIYVGGTNGEIFAIDSEAETATPLETTLDGPVQGIAIRGGTLYVTTRSTLYAIDPESDSEEWQASIAEGGATAPSIDSDGTIYVGSGVEISGVLYAFNPADGSQAWRRDLGSPVSEAPAIGSDGTVYVEVGSQLLALNPSDGSTVWSFSTDTSIFQPLVLASDGTVYLGTFDGLFSVTGPEAAIEPASLDFGTVGADSSATRDATVENVGDAELEITGVSISGSNAGAFSVIAGGGSGVLAPGQTRTVTVEFAPSNAGGQSATLTVETTANNVSASLSGTGIAPPSVTTDPASAVTAGSATLNGTVSPGGAETTVTFEYGLTSDYGNTVTADESPLPATTGTRSVSAPIDGLQPGTTYHVRVVASNEVGEDVGEDRTFTTGAGPPSAITEAASDIGGRGATLNGTVDPNGGETTVAFEYGLTADYGTTVTAAESPLSGTEEQPVSAAIEELRPTTTYHYRVLASNEAGEDAGEDRTFTTGTAPPVATTEAPTEVSAEGATLNGTVEPGGTETEVTFEYGLTSDYGTTVTASQSPLSGNEEQAVSAEIEELEPGTTYHVRVVASNAEGEDVGEDRTFATDASAPTAVTEATSEITAEGATLNGAVNPGGAETTVTFEYGLTDDYGTTVSAAESPLSGTEEQPVSATIEGLQPNTTYHVRVVASNEAGEDAGQDRTFTTEIAPPTVETGEATDRSTEAATLNGAVHPGGAETDVTFEYGLTTDYGTTVTAAESPLSGNEEQAVSAGIDGLEPGATYHYRVVASNAAGTATGEDETFTTRAPELTVTPSSLDFGQVGVQDTSDAQSITIENTGDAELSIAEVALGSTEDFEIGDDTGEAILDPGGARTVEVAFVPENSGSLSTTLTVESNAGTAAVELSGTGVSVNLPSSFPTLAVSGEPQEITVTASEGFEAQTGTLHFRPGGAQTFDQVPLEPSGPSTFAGAIPASAVTERGVDFYAELSDGNLTVTFPAGNPTEAPAHLQTETARLSAEGSFEPAQYRMISLPVVPEDESIEAVLTDYGEPEAQRWRLLRWDPQADEGGTYRELASERGLPALESTFAPGVAFWLITREGKSFEVNDVRSVDGSEPFSITLQPGYNQVATPFAFPVAWSQVEAPDGVDVPREPQPPHAVVSVLQPWQGYWVFNRNAEPVDISVPPVEASAEEAVLAQKEGDTDLPFADAPDYALQLSAGLDGEDYDVRPDRHNYVGWSGAAASHFGPEDVPEVPPVGEHVRLSIIEDGTRLSGSLRPSGTEGQTWTLEIGARVDEPFARRKQVTVRFHDHGTRPPDYELQLLDLDSNRPVSVSGGQFAVTLTADRPVRRLRLVLGTSDFAERERSEIDPRATTLGATYPNPSKGPVSVDYQLAESGRVEIAVYDMLGRRVQTLVEKQQSAGRHTARWDGRRAGGEPAASGVYVIRMQTESFTGTRRFVLVR